MFGSYFAETHVATMINKLFTISLVCVLINGILCEDDWIPTAFDVEHVISAAVFASYEMGGVFIETLPPAFWKELSNAQSLVRVWFRSNFGDEIGIRRCWAEVHWDAADPLSPVRTLKKSYCKSENY